MAVNEKVGKERQSGRNRKRQVNWSQSRNGSLESTGSGKEGKAAHACLSWCFDFSAALDWRLAPVSQHAPGAAPPFPFLGPLSS